jgi:hypothetical protein
MTISISGSLPQGDGNGLAAIVSDLVRDPKAYHVVIGILDCAKITTKPDSGEVIPTARFRRVEVVTAADLRVAETLMRRALDKRTGRETLPFDLEQDLRTAFPEDEA